MHHGDADEELTEHEVPKLDLPTLAPSVKYVEFDQLTPNEKRNRLLPGTVVSVQWGIAPDGGLQFYLAVIVPPKTSGSGMTGPQSTRLRWLREVDGEDCIYIVNYRYSTVP